MSGLAKHLSLTKNEECISAASLSYDTLPNAGSPGFIPEPHFPDFDAPPEPFEGDFFGVYGAEDFPEQGSPPPPLSDDDGDCPDDDRDEINDSSDDEEGAGPPTGGWEPPLRAATSTVGNPQAPLNPDSAYPPTYPIPAGPRLPSPAEREAAERSTRAKTYVVPFPGCDAGAPVTDSKKATDTYTNYQNELKTAESDNPYAPFASKMDWQVARWAKLRGAGSTSFDDLATIEGLVEALSLSYRHMRELNKIIDKLPSGRPPFERHEIVVANEAFEVYVRDIVQCIHALLGDPEFAPLLLLVPERHYADPNHKTRVYFDMNTGKWWWATQSALEKEQPGATVIPVIISSDKTQLTLIGNKTAYPVYMTLGNLPKDIRCKPSRGGQILLAYLPTSRLLHIPNKSARRRTLANLFHACMTRVLSPLSTLGVSGMHFASGDGIVRRGHPILATFVGDYPEQLLVTGCKTGECPKCNIPRSELGDSADPSRPLRDLGMVLDALAAIDEGPLAFTRACRGAGIKPVQHPFWEDLPYTNIFAAITPDILHQLYQGVIKHLVAWLQTAYGTEEIDVRCRRLPPNHSLRHFAKGISSMSRVTGKEHQDMSRIILGLIIDLELPGGLSSARLVRATRALLDFLYLAQYPCHTTSTLKLLDEALAAFHANKQVFVDLGIREHFKLPKLHFLEHYRRSIELFGTTDNYDTQYSERLHIDFTKDAYRASNRKDEFAQMTTWLQRKEKVLRHEKFIEWRLRLQQQPQPSGRPRNDVHMTQTRIAMARHPSVASVEFNDAVHKYGASFFRDALARFVAEHNNPTLTAHQVELASGGIYFNFASVAAFHKMKIALGDVQGLGVSHAQPQDVVHARPCRRGKYDTEVPGRFDTVLVRSRDPDDVHAVRGFRVAQVRLIFKIPARKIAGLFPRLPSSSHPEGHLAYIEWFTPASQAPHQDHGLYRFTRLIRRGERLASIIPIEHIERTCHLFPLFGPVAPRDWSSDNVLERCESFLLNAFADRYMYMLVS
ncbi:hypothetical protein C8Q79DRAFT_902444 [Trametes meyenii]|nr:hypothetical protein C8Q79DRAFT_902444 [Trametes meyenii]